MHEIKHGVRELMKVQFIIFLFTTLILIGPFSCNITSPPLIDHKIIGSWKWLESCCGFGGDLRTPESTGHNIEITFTASRNYYQYNDRILKRDTFYSISQKTIWGDVVDEVLKIDNDDEMIIQFNTEDTLLLSDTCFDCYRHIYVRLDQ
jgi:hypothetical protein